MTQYIIHSNSDSNINSNNDNSNSNSNLVEFAGLRAGPGQASLVFAEGPTE